MVYCKKALDLSGAIARVALDPLKAQASLSDTTVTRSVVGREDLKQYWKSDKRHNTGNQTKGHISRGDQQAYHLQFFQKFY